MIAHRYSLIPLIALTLCGAACGPNALSDADAAHQILEHLQQRQVTNFMGDYKSCTEMFGVSGVEIVEKHFSDRTAEVEATYWVLAKHDAHPASNAVRQCYGSPEEGFVADQSAKAKGTFEFERWDSGWRIRR